jgi:hydrogenase 3 maturation protease
MSLESQLREFLGTGERKLALVGVGETLRGDDGVGEKILEALDATEFKGVLLIRVGSVPEAYIGKLVEHGCTHVLLLDAANFRGKPGEVRLIDSSMIGGQAVSTHSLPLTLFITYIEKALGAKVLLLGVQPKSIEFNAGLSPEVAKAAQEVAALLTRILG